MPVYRLVNRCSLAIVELLKGTPAQATQLASARRHYGRVEIVMVEEKAKALLAIDGYLAHDHDRFEDVPEGQIEKRAVFELVLAENDAVPVADVASEALDLAYAPLETAHQGSTLPEEGSDEDASLRVLFVEVAVVAPAQVDAAKCFQGLQRSSRCDRPTARRRRTSLDS
jgi:hypothetical protein